MKKPLPDIKGFSEQYLQLMIQSHGVCAGLFENPQLPVAEIPRASAEGKILPQPVAKFKTKDSTQLAQGSGEAQIGQQAVAQLPSAHNVILSQKLNENGFYCDADSGSCRMN